jgi:hypothetical protein
MAENGQEQVSTDDDAVDGDKRHVQYADQAGPCQSADRKGGTENHVVKEGEPVRPGDTLVRATPFVYAIQSQFRTKICDYCLTL